MLTREEKAKKIEEKLELEKKDVKRRKRKKRLIIFILLFIASIISLFLYMRFVGTTGLVVREYKITDKKIPESFHGFKIVQFSDLRYNTTIKKKELTKIVGEINNLKPDIVIFTGDLIDKNESLSGKDIEDLTNILNKIKATTDYYAIKGTNDYENNIFDVVFNQTKFKVLNNNYDLIYYKGNTPILITGVGSRIKSDINIGEAFSFSELDNIYTISLLPEPDILDEVLVSNKVNLALSGHSLNGEIRLPFIGGIIKKEGSRNYYNEYYKVNNTKLYISGGLGTSSKKLRLFNRPSINLYRLTTY